MQEKRISGFEERPHTADWALDVWALDLPMLFVEAAKGMYALMGVSLGTDRHHTHLSLSEPDHEALLVSFLSELLFLNESDHLGFDYFQMVFAGSELEVDLQGAAIASQTKAIKAVTYHNLKIRQTNRGFETTIVFDV